MKKLFLLSVIHFSFYLTGSSQGERNIWYFGSNAGMDFNGGPPVALTNSAMFTYDNCTSVADAGGNILFYSNGNTVWDKNHVPMPNGTGLLGNISGGNSAFAVKQPGNNTNYYVFTSDAVAGPDGIRYSVVDLSLQSGNGDVTGVKNIMMLSPATEKITAVTAANGIDIWIIIHQWNNSNFYSYLLTSGGLNAPVITTIGTPHQGNTYDAMGQITASPNGNKIAVAVYVDAIYELFDFNNTTGVLSNCITITGYPNAWGLEFSPDGTKLYGTQWTFASIYQFDISSNNSVTINTSATVVGTATSPDPTYKAGYLQLGPDNKIYVAKFTDGSVGRINNPNTLGLGCNFVDNAVSLAGKQCEAGFPNYLKTSCVAPVASFTATSFCLGQQVIFTNTSTNSTAYSWNFGDLNSSTATSPSHTYSSAGTYTVNLYAYSACDTDTVVQPITILPLPIITVSGNINLCSGNSTTLTATGGGTYSWNTNATTSAVSVSPTTTTSYTVNVSNGTCSDTAIVNVYVTQNPVAVITGTTTICIGNSTILNAGGGTNYSWSTGSTTSILSVSPTTTTSYTVTVSNGICSDTAIATITVLQDPVASFTSSVFCFGQAVIFSNGSNGASSYSWNFGDNSTSTSTNPSHLFNSAGTYTITLVATNSCGSSTTTNIITIIPGPIATANATLTAVTLGDSTQLIATGGGTYNWSPATGLSCTTCSNPTATPFTTTVYCVTVTDNNGCSSTACVTVNVDGSCNGKLLSTLLPNAFSPNKDDVNDKLCVPSNICIKTFLLKIYDRWGEEVFETDSVLKCWDGIYNGKELNTDVFAYYFDATLVTGEKFSQKGNISLIK